jgi:hypothetical protein
MTVILYILTFALGGLLGSFIKSPITIYKGTVRIKQKGRNNAQENDIKAEITSEMKRREVIRLWKQLKK